MCGRGRAVMVAMGGGALGRQVGDQIIGSLSGSLFLRELRFLRREHMISFVGGMLVRLGDARGWVSLC